MVTPEALQSFKEICKRKGITIDDQTALDQAEKLLGLVSAIYRPIPKDSPFLTKGGVYAPAKFKTRRKTQD